MAKKYTVTPNKGTGNWDVKVGGQTVASSSTKPPAVAQAKQMAKADPSTTQVVIKSEKGKIQTEHTYPRAKDPKRTPG